MKKLLQIGVLCALLTAALCVSAFAAEADGFASGFYGTGSATNPDVSVEITGGTKTSVKFTEDQAKPTTLAVDSEQLTVSVKNTGEDEQYLVVLTQGEGLSAETIKYIDQLSGTGGTQTFTVYPDTTKLASGGCTVYVTSSAAGFTASTATVSYANALDYWLAGYTLGDVDGNGEIDIQDVAAIIQYIVGNTEPEPWQENAAKVDSSSDDISIQDVAKIIQFIVGNIKTL